MDMSRSFAYSEHDHQRPESSFIPRVRGLSLQSSIVCVKETFGSFVHPHSLAHFRTRTRTRTLGQKQRLANERKAKRKRLFFDFSITKQHHAKRQTQKRDDQVSLA